jgi:hypothetical protein
MTASGRLRPVVTIRDFSSTATCYARTNGRVRPQAATWNTLEDTAVNNEGQGERLSSKLPVVAILLGSIAAFITAGVVSWSTPDGNLVVTLVPALAVGLTVFGLALRRVRRDGSK